MLPTMHIFGNIDKLEIPSTLVDTDACITYLYSCDDLLPNLIQALAKPNINLFRSINKL